MRSVGAPENPMVVLGGRELWGLSAFSTRVHALRLKGAPHIKQRPMLLKPIRHVLGFIGAVGRPFARKARGRPSRLATEVMGVAALASEVFACLALEEVLHWAQCSRLTRRLTTAEWAPRVRAVHFNGEDGGCERRAARFLARHSGALRHVFRAALHNGREVEGCAAEWSAVLRRNARTLERITPGSDTIRCSPALPACVRYNQFVSVAGAGGAAATTEALRARMRAPPTDAARHWPDGREAVDAALRGACGRFRRDEGDADDEDDRALVPPPRTQHADCAELEIVDEYYGHRHIHAVLALLAAAARPDARGLTHLVFDGPDRDLEGVLAACAPHPRLESLDLGVVPFLSFVEPAVGAALCALPALTALGCRVSGLPPGRSGAARQCWALPRLRVLRLESERGLSHYVEFAAPALRTLALRYAGEADVSALLLGAPRLRTLSLPRPPPLPVSRDLLASGGARRLERLRLRGARDSPGLRAFLDAVGARLRYAEVRYACVHAYALLACFEASRAPRLECLRVEQRERHAVRLANAGRQTALPPRRLAFPRLRHLELYTDASTDAALQLMDTPALVWLGVSCSHLRLPVPPWAQRPRLVRLHVRMQGTRVEWGALDWRAASPTLRALEFSGRTPHAAFAAALRLPSLEELVLADSPEPGADAALHNRVALCAALCRFRNRAGRLKRVYYHNRNGAAAGLPEAVAEGALRAVLSPRTRYIVAARPRSSCRVVRTALPLLAIAVLAVFDLEYAMCAAALCALARAFAAAWRQCTPTSPP